MRLLWAGVLAFGSVLMAAVYWDSRHEFRRSHLAELISAGRVVVVDVHEQGFVERVFLPLLKRAEKLSARVVPGPALEDIGKRLAWAGRPRNLSAEKFYSAKLVLGAAVAGLVASAGVVGIGPAGLALSAVGGGLGYVLPDLWLNSLVAKRRKAIESGLLGFVDMLAICCEAGLSLRDAVLRVSDQSRSAVAFEFRRAFQEVDLGRPKAAALEELGERTNSADLRLLVGVLVQSEKHGTPVAEVLREQGLQFRLARRHRAQELAQQASVKMLLPIVVFMFVPMMILLMGPAVLNLGRALGF